MTKKQITIAAVAGALLFAAALTWVGFGFVKTLIAAHAG